MGHTVRTTDEEMYRCANRKKKPSHENSTNASVNFIKSWDFFATYVKVNFNQLPQKSS